MASKKITLPNDLLSEKEVAELLRIKPQTLAKWRCHKRPLKYTKLWGRIYYNIEDVKEYIKNNSEEG